MSDIQMTVEARTDYDCEATGLPAQRWGESVFLVGEEQVILEVSVEESVTVGLMVGKEGEEISWKGTLEGLKQILEGKIKAR